MAEIGTEKRGHVQLEVSSSSDGIAVARRGSGTNQGNGKNVATGEVENNINHIFIIQRHTVSMMVCLFPMVEKTSYLLYAVNFGRIIK